MKNLISWISLSCLACSLNLFAQTPPAKEWTVLVYLNADNNLYNFGFLNVNQMEKVGSSDQVNIVVQFDHWKSGIPTGRYYIEKNLTPPTNAISSPLVMELGETNMGDPQVLADFLAWGVKNYPAKRYAVIVWNHGSGWTGVSYDDNPRDHLTMPELRKGLEVMSKAANASRSRLVNRGPQGIDIVNFDACIMSTIEVAYELKGVTKTTIGSQFNEPGEGEEYTKFLGPLVANPTMPTKELAETMVYQYTETYKDQGEINYTAVDSVKLENFTKQFNSSAKIMNQSAIKKDLQNVFGGGSEDLVSSLNAAYAVASQTSEATVSQALDGLIKSYGYPVEAETPANSFRSVLQTDIINIVRHFPGDVFYRPTLNSPWSKTKLMLQADNTYAVKLRSSLAKQFMVRRAEIMNIRGTQKAVQEAKTFLMKKRGDVIAFHNDFPESSPLIADAHTFKTKGAHGLTLYYLSSLTADNNGQTTLNSRSRVPTREDVAAPTPSLKQAYMELLFAQLGAPEWTLFWK